MSVKLGAVGVVGMSRVPDGPHRRIFRAKTPERRAAHALTLGGAQFVVGGNAIEHPDLVHKVVFVFVGIVRIQRVGIERDLGFRLHRGNHGFLETQRRSDGIRHCPSTFSGQS